MLDQCRSNFLIEQNGRQPEKRRLLEYLSFCSKLMGSQTPFTVLQVDSLPYLPSNHPRKEKDRKERVVKGFSCARRLSGTAQKKVT